jgi:hypothetical protein
VFGWSGKCGCGRERESGTHHKFTLIYYLLGVNGIRGKFVPFTPPSKQTPDLWMPWLVASSSLLLYLYVIEEARKGIPFGTQILKP